VTEKAPVDEHQHAGSERAEQARCQALLGIGVAADYGIDDGMGAAFGKPDDLDLGKRAGAVLAGF
jgi:hypothetical protein